MINKIFSKKEVFKSVMVLIGGSSLSQIIPLIFSPILTRVFTPADFGRLAFFMAVTAILSNVATGFYELSIILPKRDLIAINILGLIVLLSISVSLSLLMILFICKNFLIYIFNIPLEYKYILSFPISVFFTGCFQGLNYWLNRKQRYKILNYCRIGQSIVTVISSIMLGYLGFNTYGLIIGFLVGLIVSSLPLFFIIYKRRRLLKKFLIKKVAKEYNRYPKLMMPTSIMNIVASLSPIFFITKYFSPIIVGGFSFATRILSAPVAIISSAIGQVYYERLAKIANERTNRLLVAFLRTTKILSFCTVVFFVPVFLWGQEAFVVLFGDKWAEAGNYIEILCVAAAVKFIVSPLSTVFHAAKNLGAASFWQILYLLTTLTIFLVFRKVEFTQLLVIYVFHEVVLYLIYFLLMINTARRFDKKYFPV